MQEPVESNVSLIKRCRESGFRYSFLSSFGLLVISLIVNFYAANYATERASNSVTDIILSNTSVHDVDGIFVYGALVLLLCIIFACIWKPGRAPFTIKTIALFVLIRSLFISLTHISPYPGHVLISSDIFSSPYFQGIFTGDDLFFSGHTGLPFLLALIFWDIKWLRYLFLAFSGLFAVVVLMGHLHYSIDVLSAFFITYSIFHIAQLVFSRDRGRYLGR